VAGGENPGARAPGTPQTRPLRTASTQGGSSRGRNVIQFVRECNAELRRVQWPDRQQLWQATAVVLIVCAVMGVYIGVLDSLLTRVSHWLVDQYAAH